MRENCKRLTSYNTNNNNDNILITSWGKRETLQYK